MVTVVAVVFVNEQTSFSIRHQPSSGIVPDATVKVAVVTESLIAPFSVADTLSIQNTRPCINASVQFSTFSEK
jgi:hypothetical protein